MNLAKFWEVRVHVIDSPFPIEWITSLPHEEIALHLPSIGSRLGDTLVIGFDITPSV